jgi:hypothetical protein
MTVIGKGLTRHNANDDGYCIWGIVSTPYLLPLFQEDNCLLPLESNASDFCFVRRSTMDRCRLPSLDYSLVSLAY